jgi:serine/threonine-protein kinase
MWNPTTAGDLAAGDRLGPFQLEEMLGAGGMGIVFRATRQRDGDADGGVVALKVLRGELSGDDTFRRRFEHEARSAAEVRNPHLVAILEAGEADGRHYLATEFVPGRTLDERIREEGPLPLADVIRAATELGAALDGLHEAGIVHRDVKASNVLLRADGTAMLTDFGLAKGQAYTVLTQPGQVMGTLDYLAPELIRGEEAGAASDLYALGCSTYECLTGTTPFGGRSGFQIGLAHLDEEPPDPRLARPECPPDFSAAVLRALEKDPFSRPATASAYARGLATAGP